MENFLERAFHEIKQLDNDDPIVRCEFDALRMVIDQPEDAIKLADEKLHIFPFKDVDVCWRRLYTDASISKSIKLVKEQVASNSQAFLEEKWLDEVLKLLDMALIMTGAPRRELMIEDFFSKLQELVVDEECPPNKRRKVEDGFPTNSFRAPELLFPIRKSNMSLSAFEEHLSTSSPIVITSAMSHWPALNERSWNQPSYLLKKTFRGRRLIPVELGRSYTDDGWGQTIIPFRVFMETYLLQEPKDTIASVSRDQSLQDSHSDEADRDPPEDQIAYLAQHDLFAQIPSLRADISVPDFCYTTPPPSSYPTVTKGKPPLEEPLLNAWFGPAGTISPLHTDPYHNILCQVVGKKYVRLYAPGEVEKLYPRGMEGEKGKEVDMSNTSAVPVDMVEMDLGVDGDEFTRFRHAKYVETVLKEGESLYIPVGWWHYVRSLTVSFSVSFWWN